VNFHNLTGVGAGNIQCYFAGFQRQDIVVAFDEIARFDQKFENKDGFFVVRPAWARS
jgi:hypothetical protein